MKKKEAQALIDKWKKQDEEEYRKTGFRRPASAIPTLEQLMGKDWNLYEQHIHLHDDCYPVVYPSGNVVLMHPEYYKGNDIETLYTRLLDEVTDAHSLKIIKRLFGFE